MNDNPEVFEGKSFKELLKDIYVNSKSKKKRIHSLMESIIPYIDSASAAAVVVPVVKELLVVEIQNDEHLVKLATIYQRIITTQLKETGATTGSSLLTDDEKKRLLEEAHDELAAAFDNTKNLDELEDIVEELSRPDEDIIE